MSDWQAWLGNEGQLAVWLAASFLLYVVASWVAWQYRYPGQEDWWGRNIDRVRDRPFIPWTVEIIRFIYYLGIPFAAAIIGLLGDDLLGFSGIPWAQQGQGVLGFLWEDWARGLGLAATAVLGTWGLWLTGRALSRRAGLTPAPLGVTGPLWERLLGILYDQVHWAFYRSGPTLWFGDVYWGVFVGLALVMLETGLNPAFWWALKNPGTAGPWLTRLGIAWISALLFLATQNLWLTIATHLVLMGLPGWRRSEAYAYAEDST